MARKPPFVTVYRSKSLLPHHIDYPKSLEEKYEIHEMSDQSDFFKSLNLCCREITTPCHIVMNEDDLVWVTGELSQEDLLTFSQEPEQFSRRILRMNTQSTKDLLDMSTRHAAHLCSAEDEQCPGGDAPSRMCTLAVRLMDGSVVKSDFDENLCLVDVKRWLQLESYIPPAPEDDEIISNYVRIGYAEKFRYAFFYPSTRHTFTESEELLRLKDIDLNNKVMLILRPDYDPSAKPAEFKEEMKRSWVLVLNRVGNVLQGLYQFFDYGVDEAREDLQDFTERLEHKDFGAPFFLETAPKAGLLVNFTAGRQLKHIDEDASYKDYSFTNGGSRAGTPSLQVAETKEE